MVKSVFDHTVPMVEIDRWMREKNQVVIRCQPGNPRTDRPTVVYHIGRK